MTYAGLMGTLVMATKKKGSINTAASINHW